MRTNQASGPLRVSAPRNRGRRNSAAERRRGAPEGRPACLEGPATALKLALDLLPLLLPARVVDAVGLAVSAVLDRRLPELDAVEVRRRRVRVVPRAAALLDLVHLRARLG